MEPDTAQSNYVDVGRVVRLQRWGTNNCAEKRVSALSTECNATGFQGANAAICLLTWFRLNVPSGSRTESGWD